MLWDGIRSGRVKGLSDFVVKLEGQKFVKLLASAAELVLAGDMGC